MFVLLLVVPIAYSDDRESCEENTEFVWFENDCYECDGFIVKEGEEILCKVCNEGFIKVGNTCILVKGENNILDIFINNYFPDNPMLGFVVLISAAVIMIMVFNNRKEIIKKLKDSLI